MLYEKERKIRETMSIMGMSTFSYYLTWFIRYFLVYFIIHVIGSILMAIAFPRINYLYFLVTFLLFDVVLVLQAFFIQVFFNRARIGIVFALLFFILQYVISLVISTSGTPNIGANTGASVVPHIAFILLSRTMIYADSIRADLGIGIELNGYSMIIGFIALLLNIALWVFLVWYLDQVVPNDWGAKKHPCFCFPCRNEEHQHPRD